MGYEYLAYLRYFEILSCVLWGLQRELSYSAFSPIYHCVPYCFHWSATILERSERKYSIGNHPQQHRVQGRSNCGTLWGHHRRRCPRRWQSSTGTWFKLTLSRDLKESHLTCTAAFSIQGWDHMVSSQENYSQSRATHIR